MDAHVQQFRDAVAIAESDEPAEAAWRVAAREAEALRDEGWTWVAIGDLVGRSESWVRNLVFAANSRSDQSPLYAGQYESRVDNAARQAVRERPEVVAAEIPKALEDEAVRAAVLSSPAGVAAVQSMSRQLHAREPVPGDEDPLPSPPAFMREFWRAVSAVDVAHDALERYGVGDVTMDPEAREAAERLVRKAGEVSAAVAERAVESRLLES
jgi:hypothetical protein